MQLKCNVSRYAKYFSRDAEDVWIANEQHEPWTNRKHEENGTINILTNMIGLK